MARRDQHRVGQVERGVERLDADRLHRVKRPRLVGRQVLKVDLRVAAAGEDVAARAVGVEIRAGAGFERMRGIVGVHEPVGPRWSRREQRRLASGESLRIGIERRRLLAHPRPAILLLDAGLDGLAIPGAGPIAPPAHLEQVQVLERAELVVGRVPLAEHRLVVEVVVELHRAETKHVVARPAVANHALCPRGIMPLLRLYAGGMLLEIGRADRKVAVLAFGGHEHGVGLLIVPLVAVAGPFPLLFEHEAGLDPAAGRGIALDIIDRERLHEHRAVGKVPATGVRDADLRRHDLARRILGRRQREEPGLVGTVAPERRNRLVGNHAIDHAVLRDVGEEAALGEFSRERRLVF